MIFFLNCKLNKTSLWFKANKLSLNLTETKYSISPGIKREIFKRTTTIMDNIAIERENVTKFLGVLIDEYLS